MHTELNLKKIKCIHRRVNFIFLNVNSWNLLYQDNALGNKRKKGWHVSWVSLREIPVSGPMRIFSVDYQIYYIVPSFNVVIKPDIALWRTSPTSTRHLTLQYVIRLLPRSEFPLWCRWVVKHASIKASISDVVSRFCWMVKLRNLSLKILFVLVNMPRFQESLFDFFLKSKAVSLLLQSWAVLSQFF